MIQRVRQFYRAVTASLDEADCRFVQKYLTLPEQKLFKAMQLYDQRHALNVAYTARQLVRKKPIQVDELLLMKACLLHDIGRNAANFWLIDKVAGVLMAHFMPKLAQKWAQKVSLAKDDRYSKYNRNKSFWRRRIYALYIYYHHAQIGAAILSDMDENLREIAVIVSRHHDVPCADDSETLRILRQADELN